MCQNCNQGMEVDLSESVFVGDASGRVGDHSDSDAEFARAAGLQFLTPQEAFGERSGKEKPTEVVS